MRNATQKPRAIALARTEAETNVRLVALGLLLLPALLLLLIGP